MTIHGKGDTRRNSIHTDDVTRAIEKIINKGTIGDVYNIGTNQEFTVLEIAEKIINIIKPNENLDNWIEYIDDRPFNDYRYSVNPEKLKLLGWRESENFDEKLYELIQFS